MIVKKWAGQQFLLLSKVLCLGAICADAGISISMSEEALKNYFNDLPRLLKSGIFR